MTGTDVAAAEAGGEVATQDAVAAAALAGLSQEDLVLPVLKVTQQLSAEVTSGDADSGEFVNSLTGDNHGNEVGLIIAAYFKGRFYAPKDEDGVYIAQGDVAPSNWPEEFAGRRFDEIEVAEEQVKERANAPGGSWSAPLIQTTHNYIGFVEGDLSMPVRLSLKSTSTRAHRKIATLVRLSPGPQWSNVFQLATKLEHNKRDQPYYTVTAVRGRATTEEEQAEASKLAQAFLNEARNVVLAGESNEAKEARSATDATDGLDVT